MTNVLRTAYVNVAPKTDGFDVDLKEQLRRKDPGGKAGKLVGSQLNAALRRVNVDTIDIKANPRDALLAIAATEERLKALSRDSATVEVKVRTEKALGELRRFKKSLGDVGGDAGPGPSFGKSLISGIGDAAAAVRPILLPALAGAAVAASPFIGATIAGAVVGAAGIGGVAGGLILAARDPRVKAAAANLGQEVMAGLTTRAEVFVGPALQGVEKVRSAWHDFDGDLRRIFDTSSGFVAPLIDGLLSGALKVGKGFANAVVSAKPVIDQLARTFDDLGGAVGDLFTNMGKHAGEGALAIRDLTGAVVGLTNTVSNIVGPLATVYGWLSKANGAFKDFTGGLSILESLNPLTPLKLLGEELLHVTGITKAAPKAFGEWHDGVQAATAAAAVAAVTADDVTAAQKRLTDVQGALTTGLSALGGATTVASQNSAALRTAMDNLYGAAIRNTDANEAYQASWDSLTSSVSANGRTLNIHTLAGRANRDALEGLITSTGELYLADIAAGVSIAAATKKHQDRIAAVKEEAKRVGLNKQATDGLITTYGQIPKKKTTELLLDGVKAVVQALQGLYLYQRALATGRTVGQTAHEIANEKGLPKSFQGPVKGPDGKYYAEGGWTGPGSKYQPAGVVHADEFVISKHARRNVERQAPGFLDELNATGQMPGYAGGGPVAPVDGSRRWPFAADVSGTKVMSRAEAASKVTPAFGNWPSSPGAQRGDSGVWRSIVALIKSTGPLSGSFGNAYRPGDPLWHGSGRAVDWMGFNQDPLASFLAARRPLELIHRTNKRDYAYTRGVNKGSFNNSLMEAHRNHVHIAMANGGVIREPVLGVGASGRSYSFGEGGRPETVTPGVGGGAGSVHFHFHNSVVTSERQAVELVTRAYKTAKSERKL